VGTLGMSPKNQPFSTALPTHVLIVPTPKNMWDAVLQMERPLDYFILFFTADILGNTVLETNRYVA